MFKGIMIGIMIGALTMFGGYQVGHNAGSEIGHRQGFSDGYKEGMNILSMGWFRDMNRFNEFRQRYGSLHSTPWDEFSIREKLLLCAYGSLGNKLSDEDMQEVITLWGGGDK